jgi:cytochrome b561
MNISKRYNPAMVTLHWLTVILMLGAGFLAEDDGGGSPINIHIILGSLLLVVLLVRVVVRLTTKHPEWADTGNKFLNQLGGLVHLGLYLAAFFILGMGALIAYNRNLFAYVLGTGSAGGRVGFLGPIHHLGWILAMGLILLHVGAAFYHQFILKDNLLSRMWYGK